MPTSQVTPLVMPAVPRQFALVLDENDPDYEEYVRYRQPTNRLVWWGMAFTDNALLFRPYEDGRLDTARHSDVEAALDRWRRLYPLKVEWL
ncbi:MAG: hypothetical protein WCA46_01545 [Actinocatenispora sp.]